VLVDLHFKTGPVGANGEPAGRDEVDLDPKKYFGLTVLQRLQREFPLLPTIVFSAMERGEVSLDFTAYGAEGFLPRNATSSDLVDLLGEHGLLEDVRESNLQGTSRRIVGRSLPLLLALRKARKVAKLAGNVLVTGETGTGKELFASYLHAHSPFANGPYKVFLTQGVSEALFEGEFFGYVGGVFTGQRGERAGFAELANNGTLFIDECSDIPRSMQSKFNRLLEENTREVQRMGAHKSLKLRLQVVLATNLDLRDLVAEGVFRSDFVNRITGHVVLPPLRERREDIPLLVETFVNHAVQDLKATPRDVTSAALDMLCNAPWHGNVRELRNTIVRAVVNHRTVEHLHLHHLEVEDSHGRTVVPTPTPSSVPEGAPTLGLDELVGVLEAFQAPEDYAGLQGRLPKLRRAFALCLAHYLKAALMANTKHSPQNPDGEVNYTGAVKCMTGLMDLKTGEAMDEIKRLLQVDPDFREQVVSQDPILSKAWQTAVKARKGPSNRQ
jgi:DNA-binding NtrC family response regulator